MDKKNENEDKNKKVNIDVEFNDSDMELLEKYYVLKSKYDKANNKDTSSEESVYEHIKTRLVKELKADLYLNLMNELKDTIVEYLSEKIEENKNQDNTKEKFSDYNAAMMDKNPLFKQIATSVPVVGSMIEGVVGGFKGINDDNNIDLSKADQDICNLTVQSTLGDYLKEHGISQTWLAEQSGISRNTIINIIKNPNSVSYINAKKISFVLGETMHTLFPVK